MEQNQEKFDELYDSFNKEFPIEKLSELQLEKYTNLTKDSFCYWIETKTKDLGDIHGSTSTKFGIYQFNKTPTDTKCLHDDKYAWLKKYGNTSKSAYDNILPNIVSIAKYARSGEFEKIDAIDISEMFKWKIAFLYSERKLINWFSKELLIEFVKHFGESVDEKTPTSKLQKILINKKGSKSLMEFDNILTPIWEKLKNNNSTATEITSTQNGDPNMSTTSNSLTSKLKDLLLHTHNLILHGAPGTGKTHLAHEIAKELGCSKNEVGFVQFHPSYDYTDFVEGLRPVKSSDRTSNIGFERKDGVFKEFCKRALKNPANNFLFIIDEINRGELSKIFGELFYAIEPGYRGEKGRIQTQYQNLVEESDVFKDGFFIPENVYIIGTMNDIDRSVDTMDFAFRRRFTFYEIKAEDTIEMLDEIKDESIRETAKNRMKNLNYAIWHKPEKNEKDENKSIMDSSSYHIGGAYFLKLNELGGDFEQLWNYHLEGLLREYLRGRDDAEEKLDELKKAYDSKDSRVKPENDINRKPENDINRKTENDTNSASHSEQGEESADE